ncbi:MAG: hypothetical protein ABGX08_17385 [Citromicrobium sp.]
MTEGLNDFLDGSETEAEPQIEATPEPEAEQPKDDRPRDENGRFAPKTGVEPEPEAEQAEEPEVPPTKDKLPQEEFAGLKDERRKRQEAEQRLEALEKQLQQLQAPKDPPPPPPSMWEDEEGWQRHLQTQIMQQADQLSRINASEMAARSQHEDFQSMFDLFNQLAVENPSIVQQAMADPHPWGKAYSIAKNHARMQELNAVDLGDLEAKLREQIKVEMEAQKPAQPELPQSLAGAQSARNTTNQPFTPPSLDDILRR